MIFRINGCSIDTKIYEVRRDGIAVPVERQVFDLLVLLLERSGQVVTKDEIIDRIWNGRAVSDAALSSRVKLARKAIGDDGASQAFIRTIRGRGFRIVGAAIQNAEPADKDNAPQAPVATSLMPSSGQSEPGEEQYNGPPGPSAGPADGLPVKTSRIDPSRAAAPALLIVALLVTFGIGRDAPRLPRAEPPELPTAALGMPAGPGIAILRLTQISDSPGSRYLGDAITEEIATLLIRFSELRVADRDLTTEHGNAESDITTIGQRLGVEYLVKGSIVQAGDRIRITVYLLKASTGRLLWTEVYDRNLAPADIFEIQDDIASKIVATVASISAGAVARDALGQGRAKPPRELSAYECVVRANELMHSGFSAGSHLATRTCLEAAVASEPDYTAAWAMLAWVHTLEYTYGYNKRADSEPRQRALVAARRALELDSANPISRFAMARAAYIMRDLPLFYTEAAHALTLNPHDPLLLGNLGSWLSFSGRWDDGIAMVKKAIMLNSKGYPRWWHAAIGKDHYRRHEFQAALDEFKKMNLTNWWWYQLELTYTYGQLGDVENAQIAITKLLELYPGFDLDQAVLEHQKYSFEQSYIDLVLDGLRKAGFVDKVRSTSVR